MSRELFTAIADRDPERVRQLLESGTAVDARDDDGATPLMHAAHAGDLALVRMLLASGADVHAVDHHAWTAIAKATHNAELDRGFPEVAQALIDAGADVEARIGYGVRPLMLAAAYGEAAVAQVLIDAGADVLARNDGGLTALMMVKEKFHVDVINLLHEAERAAGAGEGSCGVKLPPRSTVVTFRKP